jgi:hypothetical protein
VSDYALQANLNPVNPLAALGDNRSSLRSEALLSLNKIAGNRAVQRVVSVQRSTGRPLVPVQRDLEGIYEVLKGVGGKGKSFGGGNWTKLLEETKKYERYEEEMRALNEQMEEGGDNTKLQGKIDRHAGKMEALLGKMQKHSGQWLGNREGNENLSLQDQERKRLIHSLAPRMTMAKRHIYDPIEALTDKTLNEGLSQNEWKGGQKKMLDKLVRNDGTETIYTSEQHDVLTQDMSEQEEAIGIEKENPQYGARAVAMSELDKLLGTNLLVKTQFGTHKSQENAPGGPVGEHNPITRPTMGIHMDKVKGEQLRDMLYDPEQSSFVREEGSNKLSLDDPMLQQELNKLQFLDVLSGQVDRHMGNIHVDRDKNTGKVTKVTGIDNDMAFGKNQTTLEPPKWDDGESKAPSWKGLPSVIDRGMYDRLMRRSLRGHVSDSLTGLLPEEEVSSTLERLDLIQQQLGTFQQEQIIGPGGWNQETAKLQSPSNSYLGQARFEKFGKLTGDEISGKLKGSLTEFGFGGGSKNYQPVEDEVVKEMTTHSINPTVEGALGLIQGGMQHLDTVTPRDEQSRNQPKTLVPIFNQWTREHVGEYVGGQQGQEQVQQNNAPQNQWVAPIPQNLPPPMEWTAPVPQNLPPPTDWLNPPPPKQEEYFLDDFSEFTGMNVNHRRGFNMTQGFSLV